MKIGIFGGTFDPFTEAHKAIVKKVLDENLVDKVIVVPTVVDYYRNPDDKWLTDGERMAVIKARVIELNKRGYNVHCLFDEIETGEGALTAPAWRKGRRFYHTLVDVISNQAILCDKDAEYHTIIGTDQFTKFKSWFMCEDILKLSKLIVVQGRDGVIAPTTGDVPFQYVRIDGKFERTSATAIRRAYKGTENAFSRYINRQPPLREKLLHHTPIFDLVEKSEVQPGFRPVGLNAPDWVMVVIRDRILNQYVMVRQIRYGTMKEYTEFVCGQVEKGENPVETAVREVREETGIVTDSTRLVELGSFATNPAFMNNMMHFYLLNVCEDDMKCRVAPTPDEHERISFCRRLCCEMNELSEMPGAPAYRTLAIKLVNDYDNAKEGH